MTGVLTVGTSEMEVHLSLHSREDFLLQST